MEKIYEIKYKPGQSRAASFVRNPAGILKERQFQTGVLTNRLKLSPREQNWIQSYGQSRGNSTTEKASPYISRFCYSVMSSYFKRKYDFLYAWFWRGIILVRFEFFKYKIWDIKFIYLAFLSIDFTAVKGISGIFYWCRICFYWDVCITVCALI